MKKFFYSRTSRLQPKFSTQQLIIQINAGLLCSVQCVCGVLAYILVANFVYLNFLIVKKSLKNAEANSDGDFQPHAEVLKYRSLSFLCTFFNTTFCKIIVPGLKCLMSLLWSLLTAILFTGFILHRLHWPCVRIGLISGLSSIRRSLLLRKSDRGSKA